MKNVLLVSEKVPIPCGCSVERRAAQVLERALSKASVTVRIPQIVVRVAKVFRRGS